MASLRGASVVVVLLLSRRLPRILILRQQVIDKRLKLSGHIQLVPIGLCPRRLASWAWCAQPRARSAAPHTTRLLHKQQLDAI